jgi:nucleotide-binding universal stress UspA family protein
MKSILVGYDGTSSAEQALARAVELARAFGGKVTVVSVVAPQPLDMSGAFGLMPYSTYEVGHPDPHTDELIWDQHREPASPPTSPVSSGIRRTRSSRSRSRSTRT